MFFPLRFLYIRQKRRIFLSPTLKIVGFHCLAVKLSNKNSEFVGPQSLKTDKTDEQSGARKWIPSQSADSQTVYSTVFPVSQLRPQFISFHFFICRKVKRETEAARSSFNRTCLTQH